MRTATLPRPLSAFGLAAALALLSGCNPCDYEVDARDTQRRPVPVSNVGLSDEHEALIAKDHEKDKRTPAEKEAAMRQKLREEASAMGKTAPPPQPAQLTPDQKRLASALRSGDAMGPSLRKATLTECGGRYGSDAVIWLLGILGVSFGAHVVSKRLTGRSLVSWLTGKKPT